VQTESCYGRCLPMVDLGEHIRRAGEHSQPRTAPRSARQG
jgi:hypothetical protein